MSSSAGIDSSPGNTKTALHGHGSGTAHTTERSSHPCAHSRNTIDYNIMLAKEMLDGVIATSHTSHYQIARYCLKHDLHMMLEKPMTLYACEARELVQLAG